MLYGMNTLDDFEPAGKTVICRIDINQPVDKSTNTLKSINRIMACIPTIRELSEKKAKVVLLAHQGSDVEYCNYYTTEPHSRVLSRLLGQEVEFIDDICGPAARRKIKALEPGQVILLDNVRFLAEEQTLFELHLNLSPKQQAQTLLVSKLAPLADLYICDAFAAAHRNQPSLCGFEQILPSAMGRLFERELRVLSGIMENSEHPCIFILGGQKVADAFKMMESVLNRGAADMILTGGLVANILLHVKGEEIGSESMNTILKSNYGDSLEKARRLYAAYNKCIILPKDIAYSKNGKRCEAAIGSIPNNIFASDIGMFTAKLYSNIILNSKTVFVNGPLGVFERPETELGTKTVWNAIGNSGAFSVLGGGDSIAAAEKFGLINKISYICTGGGSMIRFLSGEELPVIKALKNSAKAYRQ